MSSYKRFRVASAENINEIIFQLPHQEIEHLKRYVKSLTDGARSAFLQFITGSDIIICDSLEVTFVSVGGFAHRPLLTHVHLV